MSLKLSDFFYDLPEELIAQTPARNREESRLMVLDRKKKTVTHQIFSEIIDLLPSNGLLVVNDARVVPTRLFGRRETGGRVEVFILEPPVNGSEAGVYELECLTRPSRRLHIGVELVFGPDLTAEIVKIGEEGRRYLRFHFNKPPGEVLESLGRMPLPPYIKRDPDEAGDESRMHPITLMDRDRYQTVYANASGAVAAPTAGLHFSPGLLESFKARGFETRALTLLVGYGTFAPVRVEDIALHKMHSERVVIPADTAEAVNRAKQEGRPVIAVGTTVVRSLEYTARNGGGVEPYDGKVDLFIYPGYEYRIVDHLITNFHLPESTLLMLVSAFAGRDFTLRAYRDAVEKKYRFFSYGDAMLIK